MLIYVLVLNWNGWHDTLDCLASLDRLHDQEHHVLVIDNGSSDGSAARLRAARPDVEIVEIGENLGFGGGNNCGIRIALERGADFVWLLNNDTVVDPGALEALIDEARRSEDIGLVASLILRREQPEIIQAWGGGRLSFLSGRTRDFKQAVAEEEVHFLTAASLLARRAVLEQTGGFDSRRFFMYWEDVDLCLRARQLGWRLRVAERSRVWHREAGTLGKLSGAAATYYNASAVRFMRRHCAYWPVPATIGVGARMARRLMRGDWHGLGAVARGAWTGWRWSLRACSGARCP